MLIKSGVAWWWHFFWYYIIFFLFPISSVVCSVVFVPTFFFSLPIGQCGFSLLFPIRSNTRRYQSVLPFSFPAPSHKSTRITRLLEHGGRQISISSRPIWSAQWVLGQSGWAWKHTPFSPAFERQRWLDLSEFEAKPGRHSKFQAIQSYTVWSYLKTSTIKKKKTNHPHKNKNQTKTGKQTKTYEGFRHFLLCEFVFIPWPGRSVISSL